MRFTEKINNLKFNNNKMKFQIDIFGGEGGYNIYNFRVLRNLEK